jgi:hypothetical protein
VEAVLASVAPRQMQHLHQLEEEFQATKVHPNYCLFGMYMHSVWHPGSLRLYGELRVFEILSPLFAHSQIAHDNCRLPETAAEG